LGDNDYAGLIVFGLDANMVYKGGMLKVGPNRNYMMTQIRNINPGDMPDFDAALNVAYKGLVNTKAYLKHCIILSDGDPSPPAPQLVQQFNKARITVSTIVINPHDGSGARNMYEIAKAHGGRFYQVTKPSEIPNIFLKEAATVSRSAIIEETFVPKQTGQSSIIKGISSTPPLLGYVGTSAKPTTTLCSRRAKMTRAGDVAIRLGQIRRVDIRRAPALGGRLAALARLLEVLGADRALEHEAKQRQRPANHR
jgi:hypothetical protein